MPVIDIPSSKISCFIFNLSNPSEIAFSLSDSLTLNSDAFLILPGGIGTADEFFDVLNLASLGLITKKIIVYNKNDCWTDLLTWIDKAKNMEMLRTIPKNLVIAENIDELIFALKSYV